MQSNRIKSVRSNNRCIRLIFNHFKELFAFFSGRLCHLIDSKQTNNLTAAWKYYATENHGTVIMPGIFYGLKTLFEGMELPVKEIPNNPKLIEEQYRKLSRKLHFNFIPDEILIENLAKYAISVDRKDSALELYEYNCKNYPDSHNAQKNKSKITSPLTTK